MQSGDAIAEGSNDSCTPDAGVSGNHVSGNQVSGNPVSGISVPPIADAEFSALVARVEAAVAEIGSAGTSKLFNDDRRALMARMETVTRSLVGCSHDWLNELIEQHGLDVYPGSVPASLGAMLRITSRKAGIRVRVAEKLGVRSTMSGERLEPVYAIVAAAQRSGAIDSAHVDIILNFFKHLPEDVDAESRIRAEIQLVDAACAFPPDQLSPIAARLDAYLNPDGDFDPDGDYNPDDPDSAGRRKARDPFFYLGDQGTDGMSEGRFCIDAETRAYMEAMFAKWARPGMCNPRDHKPVVDAPAPTTPKRNSRQTNESTDTSADEPTTDETEPAVCEPEPTVGKPEPAVGKPEPAVGETEPTVGKPGPTVGKPEPTVGKPEPAEGERGPAEGEPEPATAGTDSVVGESDSGADTLFDVATDEPDAEAQKLLAAAAARDTRSQQQRQHDAIKTVLRQILASGNLGRHRGLPVTAVVTMTLQDLENATGVAVSATGSLVPIRDAIRMASHANHYLAIFDDHGRALHLGRSKRIASADQRIVLIASDRGCSFPACTRPATWSQVHHIDEWHTGGNTDIDSLTFCCDEHHALATDGTWIAVKAGPDHPYPGRTLWKANSNIDPHQKEHLNHYHHPEEILYPPEYNHAGTNSRPQQND